MRFHPLFSSSVRRRCFLLNGIPRLLGLALLGVSLVLVASPAHACQSDADCTNPGLPYCVSEVCGPHQPCTSDSDCTDPSEPTCDAGTCGPTPFLCASDADCLDPSLPHCDPSELLCVPCYDDSQCGSVEACIENVCAFGCPAAPRPGCDLGAKGSVFLYDHDEDAKDKLKVKIKDASPARSGSEFGDPVNIHRVALCLYDQSILVSAIDMPPDTVSWKPLGDKGFLYKDKDGPVAGTTKVLLKAGSSATAKPSKAQWIGKGADLPDPTVPFQTPLSVHAQFQGSDGFCSELLLTAGVNADKGKVRILKAK